MSAVGELVMRLFHARTAAHVLHLQTRSYAAHKALNEFYDAVVDNADSIAEAYQGRYGLISFPASKYTPETDGLTMLRGLRKWIDENRGAVCDCEEVQNEIDTLLTTIDSAIYKLRFLS